MEIGDDMVKNRQEERHECCQNEEPNEERKKKVPGSRQGSREIVGRTNGITQTIWLRMQRTLQRRVI